MNRVFYFNSLISLVAGLSLALPAVAAEEAVHAKVAQAAKSNSKQTSVQDLAQNSADDEADQGDDEAKEESSAGRPSYTQKVLSYLVTPVTHAWQSVQVKVDDLKTAEETRDRLVLENANLRMKFELSRFSCQSKDAETFSKVTGDRLQTQTGSREGRALASLHYQIPQDLAPAQLYTLGISYFKAKEDEKAAAIFTMLSGMEDSTQFQTAKVYVMSGVSWYRLLNFDLAKRSFQKALAIPMTPENQEYLAQARLWSAVIAQRSSDHVASQNLLKELLEHHPHSTEAAWVNGNEVSREAKHATAAVSESKE